MRHHEPFAGPHELQHRLLLRLRERGSGLVVIAGLRTLDLVVRLGDTKRRVGEEQDVVLRQRRRREDVHVLGHRDVELRRLVDLRHHLLGRVDRLGVAPPGGRGDHEDANRRARIMHRQQLAEAGRCVRDLKRRDAHVPEVHARVHVVVLQTDVPLSSSVAEEVVHLLAVEEHLIALAGDLDAVAVPLPRRFGRNARRRGEAGDASRRADRVARVVDVDLVAAAHRVLRRFRLLGHADEDARVGARRFRTVLELEDEVAKGARCVVDQPRTPLGRDAAVGLDDEPARPHLRPAAQGASVEQRFAIRCRGAGVALSARGRRDDERGARGETDGAQKMHRGR